MKNLCKDDELMKLEFGRILGGQEQDQLLISNDICLKSMWLSYGGMGDTHILRGVKYMAEENGIDEDTYLSLLTKNVVNFIA